MKRPFLIVGFSVALAQAAALFLDWRNAYLLCAVFAVGGAAALAVRVTRKRGIIPLAFLCAAAACFTTGLYLQKVVEPPRRLDGMQAMITAKVVSSPERNSGRELYEVETLSVALEDPLPGGGEVPQRLKLRFSSSTPLDISLYDVISAKVYLQAPSAGNGYTSKLSYQSEGIYLFAYLQGNGVEIIDHAPHDLRYAVLRGRSALLFQLGTLLPETQSSLIAGLMLGEKSGISDQVIADFKVCGISHLLAVSGLHTAFFAQMLLFLFLHLHIPRRLAHLLAAVGVLLFAALAGFTPSVSRAAVMTGLYLLGGMVFRQPDSLNSLGLAALIICAVNPCAAGGLGFQLSFLATLGIVMFCTPVSRRLTDLFGGKLHTRLARMVATSLAASASSLIFTMPVMLLAFGSVSLLSFVANIFTVLPAQAAMMLGMFATALSFWPPLLFLAKPLALAAGILANYLVSSSHLIAMLSAPVTLDSELASLWICAVLVLAGLCVLLATRKRIAGTAAVLSIVLLLCGILTDRLMQRGVVQIGVVDCGEGVSVAMVQEGGGVLLTSEGGKSTAYRCEEFLDEAGCENLYLLIAPSEGRQPVLTAAELMKERQPQIVWSNQKSINSDEVQAVMAEDCARLDNEENGILYYGDKISLYRINSGSGIWYDCNVGDISILIAVGSCDAADLQNSRLAPDLLVLSRLPAHMERLRANVALLSVPLEQEEYLASKIEPYVNYMYSTGRNGTMSISTTGNRDILFR